MTTNDSAHKTYQTWLEERILYVEIKESLPIESILKLEVEALQLLKQQQQGPIPAIVIMDKLANGKPKIGLSDFSKILSSTGITKYMSALLMVGVSDSAKRYIGMLNSLFFSNRIHFYETIEEAQIAARASMPDSESILEQH
jgi:hypothetical protein